MLSPRRSMLKMLSKMAEDVQETPVSMPPPDLKVRFRLRENALQILAAAIGDEAYRDARGARLNAPNQAILTGENRSGLPTRVLTPGYKPDSTTMATIAARYALASGTDFQTALFAMFETVDEDGNPVSDETLRAAYQAEPVAA